VLPAVARLYEALTQSAEVTAAVAALYRDAEETSAARFGGVGMEFMNGGTDGRLFSGKDKVGDVRITGTESPENPTAFLEGAGDGSAIHPNDVAQGAIGDCYLMAGLMAAAHQNPALLQNLIRDNGDGTYTVTLYEQRMWAGIFPTGEYEAVEVTVTADFPVGEVTRDGVTYQVTPHANYGDEAGGQTEVWAALIEKAYAERHGGYGEIVGGWPSDAMTALTGMPSTTHGASSLSLEALGEMMDNGYMMSISTRQDGFLGWGFGGASEFYVEQGFVGSHAYTITAVDVEAGTVTLQNPWGWNGEGIVVPYEELGNFDDIFVNPGP
jgi:hypothetical protein